MTATFSAANGTDAVGASFNGYVVALGVPISDVCHEHFPDLREIAAYAPYQSLITPSMNAALRAAAAARAGGVPPRWRATACSPA
mgnify:CR=1 FL=1